MSKETTSAVSADSDYVRRDVFDAHMQRIDQRFDSLEKRMDERFDAMRIFMEKTLTEMKADNARVLNEMKADNAQLRSEMQESNSQLRSEIRVLDTRIEALNTRIDSVQTTVYWGFALMGIVVAMLGFFITFAPSIWGILRRRRRAALSKKEMENIENLVNASLDKYFGRSPNLVAKPQSA